MIVKNLSFYIVLAVFTISGGFTLADCPSADLTGDCFVNMEDFAVMASLWLSGDPNIPDDMVYIPNGGFEMGDHFEPEGYDDELPLHPVLLDAFFMGKYEITNQQYCDFLNSAYDSNEIKVDGGVVYDFNDTGNSYPYCDTYSASTYSQIDFSDPDFSVRAKGEPPRDMNDDPMVEVSWYGSVAYCNWRSSTEGYEECYDLSTWDCNFSKHGYRLATEAEWEYAARGGLAGKRFPWNDPNISHSRANYYSYWQGGSPYYPYDESLTEGYHPDWDDGVYPYTSPAGTFAANGYGLYDMAGNVWEWCNDWYASDYYDTSPYDDPTGPVSGSYRVLRGGGWYYYAYDCRVAVRFFDVGFAVFRLSYLGFRIVLDLE